MSCSTRTKTVCWPSTACKHPSCVGLLLRACVRNRSDSSANVVVALICASQQQQRIGKDPDRTLSLRHPPAIDDAAASSRRSSCTINKLAYTHARRMCGSHHGAAPIASPSLEPKEFGHTGLTDRISDMSSTPSDATQFVVMDSELSEQQQLSDSDELQHAQPQHHNAPRRRVLSTLSLLSLCFFSICSGPIGAESVITAGGPAIGLAALVVFPIVFYAPLCFMVTELVTTLPAAGGHAYWIAKAFGPQLGFQAGYWSWVSNCVNCALISSLAVALFAQNVNGTDRSGVEEVFRQALPLLLALPGFLSLRRVGQILSVLLIAVLLTFIILTISSTVTATHWRDIMDVRYAIRPTPLSVDSLIDQRSLHVDVEALLNNLIWSFHGFHNISVFVTEVKRPLVTYKRVLWLTLAIIPLMYVLPMAVAVANGEPKWTKWADNAVGDILISFRGTTKDVVVGFLLLVSVVGLYLTGLTSSAFLATGMAAKRFGPPGFASSSSSQTTPHGAILSSLPVMLIIVNIECDDMIRIANALGGLCSLTLIGAAVRLRFTHEALERPFRLCGDLHVAFMIASLLVPTGALVYATYLAFKTTISGVLTGVFVLIGLVYGQRSAFTHFDNQ